MKYILSVLILSVGIYGTHVSDSYARGYDNDRPISRPTTPGAPAEPTTGPTRPPGPAPTAPSTFPDGITSRR